MNNNFNIFFCEMPGENYKITQTTVIQEPIKNPAPTKCARASSETSLLSQKTVRMNTIFQDGSNLNFQTPTITPSVPIQIRKQIDDPVINNNPSEVILSSSALSHSPTFNNIPACTANVDSNKRIQSETCQNAPIVRLNFNFPRLMLVPAYIFFKFARFIKFSIYK